MPDFGDGNIYPIYANKLPAKRMAAFAEWSFRQREKWGPRANLTFRMSDSDFMESFTNPSEITVTIFSADGHNLYNNDGKVTLPRLQMQEMIENRYAPVFTPYENE
jgi:hypothetical protein